MLSNCADTGRGSCHTSKVNNSSRTRLSLARGVLALAVTFLGFSYRYTNHHSTLSKLCKSVVYFSICASTFYYPRIFTEMSSLNAHQRPPESIQSIYKKYRGQSLSTLDRDPHIIDLSRGINRTDTSAIRVVRVISSALLQERFSAFSASTSGRCRSRSPVNVYEHDALPGGPMNDPHSLMSCF